MCQTELVAVNIQVECSFCSWLQC